MTYLLLAVAAALQATALERPDEISLLAGPRHYLERQYAAGPAVGADYLFLTGEAVQLEVLFVNRTNRPLTIVAPPGDLGRSMKLALTRSHQGTPEQMPFAFIQDGPLQLTDSTGQRDFSWEGRIELVPKAIVSLPLKLERSTEPRAGIYELRVTEVQTRCEPSCVVYNHGGLFRFEIRTTTSKPEQLDRLARQAYHAIYYEADFASADRAIAEMLRIHPRSVVAYYFKALVAEERKDLKAAEENYAVALSLVTSSQDPLLPQPRGMDSEPLAAHFAERIKAVQEARRKR